MPEEKSQNIEQFLVPEKDTVELPLPSGLVVTFKMPSLAFFLALGDVPGRVANAVAAVGRQEITAEEADLVEPDAEECERRAEVACVHCIAKPKFSFTPGPGEIDVRRLRPMDKMRVYNWAMRARGGGVDLESFRTEPSGQVSNDGASGKAKRKAAKPVPKKSRVGVGS